MRGQGELSCSHTTGPTQLSSGFLAHFCRNSWGSLIPKPTLLFLRTVNNLCEESRSLSGPPRPSGAEHSRKEKGSSTGRLGKRSGRVAVMPERQDSKLRPEQCPTFCSVPGTSKLGLSRMPLFFPKGSFYLADTLPGPVARGFERNP